MTKSKDFLLTKKQNLLLEWAGILISNGVDRTFRVLSSPVEPRWVGLRFWAISSGLFIPNSCVSRTALSYVTRNKRGVAARLAMLGQSALRDYVRVSVQSSCFQ